MSELTIKDIARMANVSPATVSRVINNAQYGVGEKTRQKIQKIIDESGYQPNLVARSMITKRSTAIGLMVPDITNPFYALLVKGVEDVATSMGYSVVLCNADNNSRKELENLSYLKEIYVAGIIYNNFGMDDNIRAALDSIHVPVVYVDNQERVDNAISIHVRQKEGMRLMAEYLLEMGHREFAYLAGPHGVYSSSRRLEGFLEVVNAAGVHLPPGFIKFCAYSETGGYEATRELLGEKRKFSCLVCANDLIAYGATLLLTERGIGLPDEVSITGFDDIPFSKLLNPPLTTIYHPVQDMGRRAAKVLDSCIRGDRAVKDEVILFEPSLVKRNSVKFVSR